ncbi:ribosomal protein S18 acetylase RimI-like enzyme [Bacillus pakistanensis]|uniref:Ribosomal protein S18 acetylase RimI-like enzyme n=1 Tax=Rossellomorea pakistanensis TaxID=992288 RepID=A0ABS2NC78_9BACI|nr:GNAT family N-acetyltransferase [Bacillus pakistanensis]MBM7585472.1 ribosomal protein S18 acetylase RimI-like enzyme [Bacillus pakistanensis]
MTSDLKIEQLTSIGDHIEELSELLIQTVEDGASIGFLPPLKSSEATKYWESALSPDVILFVAKINNQVAGCVQLQLCTKQNGEHRAEIAKLMTHPNYRRNGIGRSLMQKAEERAMQDGRTLLVLDTREGDPSNHLYTSIGYIQAGRIPHYAKSANGGLDATIFYYKSLGAFGRIIL